MFKPITDADVDFVFTMEEEHLHPKQIFKDPEVAARVCDEAEHNPWAWFCAKVVARWNGIESAPEYLGCCSYNDRADWETGGYWADMKIEALADLNRKVEALYNVLKTREVGTMMPREIELSNGMKIREANVTTDERFVDPFDSTFFVIYNEFGPLCGVWARNVAEALDCAADNDLLRGLALDPDEAARRKEEDEGEGIMYLGNASEPFDSIYAGVHLVDLHKEPIDNVITLVAWAYNQTRTARNTNNGQHHPLS